MGKQWGGGQAVASIAFRVCDITCVLINRRFNKKLSNILNVVSFLPDFCSTSIQRSRSKSDKCNIVVRILYFILFIEYFKPIALISLSYPTVFIRINLNKAKFFILYSHIVR